MNYSDMTDDELAEAHRAIEHEQRVRWAVDRLLHGERCMTVWGTGPFWSCKRRRHDDGPCIFHAGGWWFSSNYPHRDWPYPEFSVVEFERQSDEMDEARARIDAGATSPEPWLEVLLRGVQG